MTDSYYGRPIVKGHVWTPAVPLYFWIGGAAGAAAVHTVIERLRGNGALATVHKRVALAGAALAPVLLVVDLGEPKRFMHMLRVFKPTSPMNVGSWILTVFGAAIGAATVAEILGRRTFSRAFEGVAAIAGLGLTTYTAVLLADTATPVWHEARGQLPFVFVASGLSGAGSVAVLLTPTAAAAPARRSMIGGALGLCATTRWMERALGPLAGEPYRIGRAGALTTISTACALAGATLGLVGGRRSATNRLAAALVIGAGVCERFAVFAAGKASAANPKYTVAMQRARLEDCGRE